MRLSLNSNAMNAPLNPLNADTTLSDLPLGCLARVKAFQRFTATDQRLMVMGLIPGVEVRKVRIAPLGDPIAVEFDGRCVSLRRQEALGVLVEPA